MRNLFLLVISLFLSIDVISQGPEKKQLPPSPNAASLGKFGQIETDYFNGLTRVQIPIYTITSGDISIPLGLGYHSSGVKIDQRGGWVGLNWSLNMPFHITRIMNGELDEKLLSPTTFDFPGTLHPFYHSYYDHNSVLDRSDWSSTTALHDYLSKRHIGLTTPNTPRGPVPSPDEFTFNFLGYSGSFFLNHQGEWKFKCNSPGFLKVHEVNIWPNVPSTTPPSTLDNGLNAMQIPSLIPEYDGRVVQKKRMIRGFTLIDGQGNKYVFGGDINAVEFSRFPLASPQNDIWGNLTIPVTYNLTEIIPVNGTPIIFEYEKSDKYQINYSDAWDVRKYQTGAVYSSVNGPLHEPHRNLINAVYLKRIIFHSGSVVFESVPSNDLLHENYGGFQEFSGHHDFDNLVGPTTRRDGYYKLNQILVYNNQNVLVKKTKLIYEESPNHRLLLTGVAETDPLDNNNEIKYLLSYYKDPLKPLPKYSSRQLDHWGFWNGVDWFSSNPGPNYTPSHVSSYYNSREPNLNYAIIGALEGITYPTGGRTKFYYKLNDYSGLLNYYSANTSEFFDPNGDITYSELSNQIANAGGLRIWKIENIAPETNQTIVTEFDYNITPTKSSGILGGLPNYVERGTLFNAGAWNYFAWKNYSAQPFGMTNGNHVTYSQVKEILPDGSYIIRKYSNSDNPVYRDQKYLSSVRSQPSMRGNLPFTSLSHERGLLLEEISYNSIGTKVKHSIYTYNQSPSKYDDFIRFIEFQAYDMSLDVTDLIDGDYLEYFSVNNVIVRNAYAIKKYIYPTLTSKVDETIWDVNGQNPIQTITELVYNEHRNVKEKTVRTSDGTILKTKIKYAADYPSTGTDNPSLAIRLLKDKNCISFPIEIITIKSNADGSNPIVVSGELNFYKHDQPVLAKQLKLVKGHTINYNSAFDSYIGIDNQFHYNENYIADPVYEGINYNTFGRTIQDKNQQGITRSYIWMSESVMIAKCDGAGVGDIAFTSFEDDEYEPTQIGNWSLSVWLRDNTSAYTGKWSYPLNSGNIYKSGLNSATQYIVTYWSNGSSALINGNAGTAVMSKRGWTLYKHIVSNTTGVTITGTVRVDELRCHPRSATMISYVYEPFVGLTSQADVNNIITYYEYDEFKRLKHIKDADGNIIKSYSYNLLNPPGNGTPSTIPDTEPLWQATGITRCKPCHLNLSYLSPIIQQQQKDMNPGSLTYNQIRWFDIGTTSTCNVTVWTNQGSPYCEVNGQNENTGNVLQLQRDINPCSPTYNQLQVILIGYYPATCPPPCSTSNCYGEGYKCVYGNCELGYKVYTSSVYDLESGMFICTYHYEWGDGTWSGDYQEYSGGNCPIL